MHSDYLKDRVTRNQRTRVFEEFFVNAGVKIDWTPSPAQQIDEAGRVVLSPRGRSVR